MQAACIAIWSLCELDSSPSLFVLITLCINRSVNHHALVEGVAQADGPVEYRLFHRVLVTIGDEVAFALELEAGLGRGGGETGLDITILESLQCIGIQIGRAHV